MIIISHRGNISGNDPSKENHPDYISQALDCGFNVELDFWVHDNKFYLGHDNPQYEISESFIHNSKFWIHAKNINAAYYLTDNSYLHWFFHDKDDCVLTSSGFLWTYPGKQLTTKSIAVMPELVKDTYDLSIAYGICTDFPQNYK